MFAYLAAGAVALLGWALYDSNKPKTSNTTPLSNALGGQPYQIGQKVRVPLNQLPPNLLPATTLATFNQVGAQYLIVQVTGFLPGAIKGNLISTSGNDGEIVMPAPVPVTIPNAIIAGTV
jgi:hypothetical protein